MKWMKGLLVAGMSAALLVGCGGNNGNEGASETPDAVSSPSIVSESGAFVNAVSADGTWIIATLNDLTVDEDVTVAGQFHNQDDASAEIYRKIALYAQDADRNITDQYTLTVPRLTVQSENLRIQGGTVNGDVYVEANGFNLHESASIDGNLYFASEEAQSSAVIDGNVTGTTELQ